jgi:hypothetical protein
MEAEREDIDAELEARLLREAAIAERNRQMRERARQIGGVPGAMMAGVMIALRDVYDAAPKRDNGAPMVIAPGEPHDVDRDGMELSAGELGGADDVTIAALDRRPPLLARARRRGRRRH